MVDFASTDDQWSTEDETNYADMDNYDPTATGDEYEPTAEWGHPDPVDDENPTVEVNDEQGHDEDDSTVTGEESAGEEGGGQDDPTTAWLDDPNTEVDEYLIHWTLTPVIARLDVYRRSASLVGKTFAELCAETRALAESGVIPPRVRSFLVPAGASLATRPTGDPGQ
ncbi:hypothetical protein NOU13_31340 [Rhodococcus erythropolis]|uniref:hypothetical protein n=1 Tax=Rhodococcus erythropolis TaxID=1833 RepID=UPI00210AFB1C|nr:hypothetical protein [Rhodococcus erythropolis]MCQ4129003.1 hypothetical protein [Rhodococcus erythropolis]